MKSPFHHGHHSHPPSHHHSSAAKLTMQVTKRVIAQQQKQFLATARAASNRFSGTMLRRVSAARSSQRANQIARFQESKYKDNLTRLQRALHAASSIALDCQPCHYAGHAAAIFFESNWTSDDGVRRVVFKCNTNVPGSNRPLAAYLWSANGITGVDLGSENLGDLATRGRLFIFPANVNFVDGQAFAVRTAGFRISEQGPVGYWTFPTVGTYKRHLFAIGHGAIGAFRESAMHRFAVVRPIHWDNLRNSWYWAGRSTSTVENNLEILAEDILASDPGARKRFLVKRQKTESNIVVLPCSATDDQGDPLCVLDTAKDQGFCVVRLEGRLHFFARPNQKDSKGRVLFAVPITSVTNEAPSFVVDYEEGAEKYSIEIAANHVDAQGRHWLFFYANAKERASGLPIVLCPLESA